ncbi:purine permease 1-like [Dendrobium catenatum]|uniref:Probable purine permease n=1 Tax=Dendrobium catenatum TaxID=906689 RepID=A0A2I0WA98_9ASPA|nr:purine permease 1-like [Dendrobium catenatum]PKU72581.1 Purine permease 1 [Dendrobium catenatum]
MAIESQVVYNNSINQESPASKKRLSPFLFLNLFFLVIGCGGMPLLLRLYFVHGGHLIWFSTFLQTAAFPLLLPPLLISNSNKPKLCSLRTPPLLLSCTILGLLTGLVNLFYAYGLSYVPVSISSLLLSTQLSFTALFSFLIVKQRFTPFSINAVVLLTVGAVILGVNSAGNRPEGENRTHYYFGFAMTLGAALLDGLLPTLSELMYKKARQLVTYTMVLETQVVMGFFATAFCAVGMLINNEFQVISKEAKEYGLGETKYYMVIISFAVVMQCFFLGRVGVVLYSSALLTGIVVDVLLPVTVVLAVIFFHEPFTSDKAVALVLSIWGFTSYVYGEIKDTRKRKKSAVMVEAIHPALEN